jgi:hypothetical protein
MVFYPPIVCKFRSGALVDRLGEWTVPASDAPAPPRRWSVDAIGALSLGAAGVLITAGGLVAAVNSAAPFTHGSWLAAYLVLVGGVAQALLGIGRAGVTATRASARRRRRELVLWNGATLAVALGVLVDVPVVVALASAALLAALASFATATAAGAARWRRLAYHGLILALAASTLVGCVLAFAA